MIVYETINEAGKRLADRIKKHEPSFNGEAIVFIGAMGICVRKILPMVSDKHTDPAVICIDTTGKYVISVLSGHIGGANELARDIARAIGAQEIITTQSDNSGLWALDTLEQRFGWAATGISNGTIAKFVNKRATALVLEYNDDGTRFLEDTKPEHVTLFHSFSEYQDYTKEKCSEGTGKDSVFELLIVVSPYDRSPCYRYDGVPYHFMRYSYKENYIQFFPPCLCLGVGCQKDTTTEAARFIICDLEKRGIARESVRSISSITLKKDEEMLQELSHAFPYAELKFYEADELAAVDVPNPSETVYKVTGSPGVAEAAALLSSKQGTLVIEKQKGKIWFAEPFHEHYFTWALAEDHTANKGKGHIEIVGAGPGNPDLISIRGRRFLEKADLILYAGSLVPRELTLCAKSGATVLSSAGMDLEEQFKTMKEFYDKGKLVVRLHTGDPCIYGAIQEQMAFFDKYGMEYHITPGISSFLAAAAELKSQFTIPEKCQTIILTRGEGRTPMPDKEKLHLLAQHQSTMCIFLSANIVDNVMKELLEGGYPPETPVAACYKLTWKEQRIYRGQLKDLAKILKENNLTLTTMIVVGEAIDNRHGQSKLYDGHFSHIFRKASK